MGRRGIKGGDIHILICVVPCKKVSLTVVTMAHPLDLDLKPLGNRNEGDDLAFIGLEVIGALWCV